MSKQYNIRWGRSDYAKLSHLVRKVNQKVFEIEVKRPDITDYQPTMVEYQELKALVKTRRDFNNLINKYERYLREGAEEIQTSSKGAIATNWEIKEFQINQNAENRRRAEAKQKLEGEEVTIAGKSTGIKRAEMGHIKENAVKPSNLKFDNMEQRAWDKASRRLDKLMNDSYRHEKREQMLRNYIKGLISEGYSDDLINIMNKIPLDKFVKVIDTDEVATFDFIYDPLERMVKEEKLLQIWQPLVDDKVNNKIDVTNIIKEVG